MFFGGQEVVENSELFSPNKKKQAGRIGGVLLCCVVRRWERREASCECSVEEGGGLFCCERWEMDLLYGVRWDLLLLLILPI